MSGPRPSEGFFGYLTLEIIMKNHITTIIFSFIATSSIAGVMPEEEKTTSMQFVAQTVTEEPGTFIESINRLIESGFMTLFLIL